MRAHPNRRSSTDIAPRDRYAEITAQVIVALETTPHWVLDPASPQAGDPGPLTIHEVADAPIRWSVCVILGRPGHQRPDGQLAQLLDKDDIAGGPLTAAAPKMRSTLQALVQWARHMGEWEASCWREAERVLAEAAGAQAPTGEP
jgi:hypothetical protein